MEKQRYLSCIDIDFDFYESNNAQAGLFCGGAKRKDL